MNIKNDMNDITIDYYRVGNFNDINSQAPFMFNGFFVSLNTRVRMFYDRNSLHAVKWDLLITVEW